MGWYSGGGGFVKLRSAHPSIQLHNIMLAVGVTTRDLVVVVVVAVVVVVGVADQSSLPRLGAPPSDRPQVSSDGPNTGMKSGEKVSVGSYKQHFCRTHLSLAVSRVPLRTLPAKSR